MNDEKNLSDFGKRLFELRRETGQSARDMSLSLGFASNYISGIENAQYYPAMQAFIYICEHLNISPKEFFDYDDSNPVETKEMVKEFLKLDTKSREYFLNLIRDTNNRPK